MVSRARAVFDHEPDIRRTVLNDGREGKGGLLEYRFEAAALVAAGVEYHASRAKLSGGLHVECQGVDGLLKELGRSAEVYEVAPVNERGANAEGLGLLAELDDLTLRERLEGPRPWGGGEYLDRLGSNVHRSVDGLADAACR